MADKPKYKKISRRAGSLVSYLQLWKGPDHLLLVKETGCVEEYKRFYFRDIQAIVMVRTFSFVVWALVLLLISLGFAGWAVNQHAAVRVVALGFLTLSGIGLLVHLIRGSTCVCWLQTGINKEKLIMFSRARQAHKFWVKIEPDIFAAQGSFSFEDMEAAARPTRPSVTVVPPPVPEMCC